MGGKKKNEATTADTTWLFSVFGIGQASGVRIVVIFLTMVTEFRKVEERDIAKKKKKSRNKMDFNKGVLTCATKNNPAR